MAGICASGNWYDSQVFEALQTRDSPVHYVVQNQISQVHVREGSDVGAAIATVIHMYPNLSRVMEDCRPAMVPDGQPGIWFVWFARLNEQRFIQLAGRELSQDPTDISLDGICVARGNRYVQARQQPRTLGNS